MFSGSYFNSYAGGDDFPPYEGDSDAYLAANPGAESHWAWPYRDVDLSMKWNDAWISNKDNEGGDGKLDRHPGYPTYTDSGAWLTNHMSGSYTVVVNGKDKEAHWTYFVKIVTPGSSDYRAFGAPWSAAGSIMSRTTGGSWACGAR